MTNQTGTLIPNPAGGQPLTDEIRASIHAGHVAEVVIYCDNCGREHCNDYTGETREVRFAAARKHLADNEGWKIIDGEDLCAMCALPSQPDDIEDESTDLPDLARAAERVDEYIRACGDGLYDVEGGKPLYARDLTALVRFALAAGDAWVVPKIEHDENRSVTPHVRDGWIHRAAEQSDPEHTRLYAAQMLAAADKAESTR